MTPEEFTERVRAAVPEHGTVSVLDGYTGSAGGTRPNVPIYETMDFDFVVRAAEPVEIPAWPARPLDKEKGEPAQAGWEVRFDLSEVYGRIRWAEAAMADAPEGAVKLEVGSCLVDVGRYLKAVGEYIEVVGRRAITESREARR